jgi:hypothetical protein
VEEFFEHEWHELHEWLTENVRAAMKSLLQ